MSRNPLHGRPVAHEHLLVHQAMPSSCAMFPVPRRARVTAETYGGDVVTIVAEVVARSGEWLCVAQDDGAWNAWVHRDCCEPA